MPLDLILPLRITEQGESFAIKDAAKRTVVYFHYSKVPEHASATQRLVREDAMEAAKICARALTEAAGRRGHE